jgi:glycosyltransferase involved in cell wall biosynthesis
MKIAVNTRFLIKNSLEGIGWFTYETFKELTNQHPECEFVFLFDRPFDAEFIFAPNVKPLALFPPARHPFLWYWWFEFSVPSALKKIKPDIFISTDNFLSLRSNIKTLLVSHDIAYEHFPEHIDWLALKYYKTYFPRYLRKANRVVTVSQYTKDDIVKTYNISVDKIDVIYNGSNDLFRPANESEKAATKQTYTQGNDFFIYIGAIQPRKNVGNLLLAFDEFKKNKPTGVKLLIAGRKAWDTEDTILAYEGMQFKNDVIFLGHLLKDSLAKVTAAATALVYPSFYEGFGIPIVEAMNCDVPVITSNVTSMPEVAGDAGLLVDPNSVQSISDAMTKVYFDSALREKLIANGRIQRQKFSWQKTAEKMWLAIEKIG